MKRQRSVDYENTGEWRNAVRLCGGKGDEHNCGAEKRLSMRLNQFTAWLPVVRFLFGKFHLTKNIP
ncbi:hypothetical protein HMPREF1992_01797 [Selenomonas sp. oral taxon 892 str. F0426]|nr:hypothetical protein HMPREF1992_01797 [Selenomonas sp. oral taxon 892 str. F0426]